MKRWVRRILMVVSVGLVVVSCSLWIRGWFVAEQIISRWVMAMNVPHALLVYTYGHGLAWNDVRYYEASIPSGRTGVGVMPKVIAVSFGPISGVSGGTINGHVLVLPHWFLFLVGSVYPAVVWLGRRRRRKSVGFPVEVGSEEK